MTTLLHRPKHPRKGTLPRWAAALFAVGACLALAPAAGAVTLPVNSTTDAVDAAPGDGNCATAGAVCTLRAAVQEANALAGVDVIEVPSGSYTLTIAGTGENAAATGDLDITAPVTITGESARQVTVSATSGDRVFHVVAGATNVELTELAITNTTAPQDGAGISNQGSLQLDRVAVRGNTASGGFFAGGINNSGGGALNVSRSEISGNTSTLAGGGLLNTSANATLTNSTVAGNSAPTGGGIRHVNAGANLSVSFSTIAANTNGGGISLGGGAGTPSVSSSLISSNTGGNCNGAVTSGGHNVEEGPVAAQCLTAPTTADQFTTTPSINSIGNNGGPTDTVALQNTSLAIGNGNSGTCPATDQRVFVRPAGSGCDSGAYELGAAPPNTTIDSGPPALSNDATPTFNFSSDIPGSTFECSIDQGTPSFTSCSSPYTVLVVPDGSYTFRVRAIDPALNVDATPDTQNFTIDTTAPQTSLDSGPSDPTNDSTPTFTFSSLDPGAVFECSIDTGIASFAPCSGPGSHTPLFLTDGDYTFRVRAVDTATNADQTPSTQNFTVDTDPPVTTIDSGPSGPTNDATPTFTFTADGASTVECSVDTGTPSFGACSAPGSHTAGPLADGSYVFRVRATDAAGNLEPTPKIRAFSVDTAPPGPTPSNGDSVVAGPEAGVVKVRVPGSDRYVILKDGDEIPVGTRVDASRGRVNITSISPAGVRQTADFYAGRFQVLQADGATIVTLALEGGNFNRCPRSTGRGAGRGKAFPATRVLRKLWGSGRGRFRTRGRGGAGTVRGTQWLTADRCDGTLFKVREGVVAVRDFDRRKTVEVRAGGRYLARLR